MFDRLRSIFNGMHKAASTTTLGLVEPHTGVSNQDINQRQSNLVSEQRICPVTSRENGITFIVDDVITATDPLWLSTVGESLEMRGDVSIISMPDQSAPALAPEGYVETQPSRAFMRKAIPNGATRSVRELAETHEFLHPLVQAVHMAFSSHRPLVLSPDSIWLAIVQGFGHHVHENAEGLRNWIVKHDGKKKLSVVVDSHPIPWPALVSQFSAQIKENSDPVLHETLLCNFSTTTSAIRTACEVALMDAYQRYFDYGAMCVCGIPKVTLEGTVDDWQRIRDRIEVLATYNLGWWTFRLGLILDQFAATAKGEPDRAFWQAIYKPQDFYFTKFATGWIADLFPYLSDEKALQRNDIFKAERIDWLPANSDGSKVNKENAANQDFASVGVSLNSFPSGLSRAPVTVTLPDNSNIDIELMGGFVGVSQRPEDNGLSPIISWAVVKKDDSVTTVGR